VKTTTVETAKHGRSPLGAHIRFLMDGPHGNMIQSTVPPGMVGRACRFRTIDEYWYVLSGEGEIWRRAPDGRESITQLIPGVCIDIPLGTAFQYRCTGDVPLVFTCTALPPWPGDDEAVIMDGPWVPCVDPELGGQALGSASSQQSSSSSVTRDPTPGARESHDS
jgi:mannose-6-phosphate isomerase-like protein (cupin superfamily)